MSLKIALLAGSALMIAGPAFAQDVPSVQAADSAASRLTRGTT